MIPPTAELLALIEPVGASVKPVCVAPEFSLARDTAQLIPRADRLSFNADQGESR